MNHSYVFYTPETTGQPVFAEDVRLGDTLYREHGSAGYVRYEENSVPDLIWFVEGKMIRCSPEVPLSVLSTIEGV